MRRFSSQLHSFGWRFLFKGAFVQLRCLKHIDAFPRLFAEDFSQGVYVQWTK